jgi:hypothetical protein
VVDVDQIGQWGSARHVMAPLSTCKGRARGRGDSWLGQRHTNLFANMVLRARQVVIAAATLIRLFLCVTRQMT